MDRKADGKHFVVLIVFVMSNRLENEFSVQRWPFTSIIPTSRKEPLFIQDCHCIDEEQRDVENRSKTQHGG